MELVENYLLGITVGKRAINDRIELLISECFNNLNKAILKDDDPKLNFVIVCDIVDAYEKVIGYYKKSILNIEQGIEHEELFEDFKED
jgi:hypothetical protein